MKNSTSDILPIEKFISVLSYLSMGIIGLIYMLIAYYKKKKLRFFLMYNITQSIIISIFLAIFKLLISIILTIVALVPFLDFIAAIINLIISLKIITVPIFHFSFTIFELLVSLLLIYIIIGILKGKIVYIPKLTKLMQKIYKSEQ